MKKRTLFTKTQKQVLVSLVLALFLIVIDGTIMNVSIKALVKDLNTSVENIQALITTYSLVMAMTILIGVRISDIVGRKKIFIIGTTLFGLGAALATFSHSYPQLLIGWSIIEGIGAALMMPATMSLMTNNFEGKSRAIAFGIWGGTASAGAAFGPIVGGFLTDNYSWRYAFGLEVILSLLVIYFATKIKEAKDEKDKPILDIPGALLSATGLGLLIYGLLKVNTYGWFHSKNTLTVLGLTIGSNVSPSFILIILGLLILTAFLLWETHIESKGDFPLVSLHLFRNKQFSTGLLLSLILNLAQAGVFFTLPIFLQMFLKLDAVQTGLALLPLSIAVFFTSAFVSRINLKVRHLLQAGIITSMIATYYFANVISTTTTIKQLIIPLFLLGLGMGMIMSQLTNLTISALDVDRSGEAAGINATLRRLGSSLGTAIIGSLLFTFITSNMQTNIKSASDIPSQFKTAIIQEIDQSTNILAHQDNKQIKGPLKTRINEIMNGAIIDGTRKSILISELFFLITFLTTFLIDKELRVEDIAKKRRM